MPVGHAAPDVTMPNVAMPTVTVAMPTVTMAMSTVLVSMVIPVVLTPA